MSEDIAKLKTPPFFILKGLSNNLNLVFTSYLRPFIIDSHVFICGSSVCMPEIEFTRSCRWWEGCVAAWAWEADLFTVALRATFWKRSHKILLSVLKLRWFEENAFRQGIKSRCATVLFFLPSQHPLQASSWRHFSQAFHRLFFKVGTETSPHGRLLHARAWRFLSNK